MMRGNVAHGAEVRRQLSELRVRRGLRVAALHNAEYAPHTLRSGRVYVWYFRFQLTAHSLAVLPGLSLFFPNPLSIDVL